MREKGGRASENIRWREGENEREGGGQGGAW